MVVREGLSCHHCVRVFTDSKPEQQAASDTRSRQPTHIQQRLHLHGCDVFVLVTLQVVFSARQHSLVDG